MATTVTVPGAQSTTISETYADGSSSLTVAQQIALSLATAKTGGILTVSDWQSPTTVPGGNIGELAVTSAGGADVTVGSGYTYVAIDQTVTGPVTITGSANLFAGNQDIVYNGSGSGTVALALGDGNNTISLPTGSTYVVGFGNGNDTVYADGTGTITGGTGSSEYFSNGTNVINSNGSDTIIAGAGATTVTTTGLDPIVYGGSGSLVYLGGAAGNPTIVGGSGTATLFGGDGQNLTYFDGTGAVTDNTILAAGQDSETINAGGSSAGVQMAVGDGSVTMLGSSGNDIFYGGDGAATITGNGGADAFIFGNEDDGHQGGTVTITDWSSSDNFVTVDYGATAAQDAVNAGTVTDAGLTATLSDGTTIIFQNVTDPTQIHNQSFTSAV